MKNALRYLCVLAFVAAVAGQNVPSSTSAYSEKGTVTNPIKILPIVVLPFENVTGPIPNKDGPHTLPAGPELRVDPGLPLPAVAPVLCVNFSVIRDPVLLDHLKSVQALPAGEQVAGMKRILAQPSMSEKDRRKLREAIPINATALTSMPTTSVPSSIMAKMQIVRSEKNQTILRSKIEDILTDPATPEDMRLPLMRTINAEPQLDSQKFAQVATQLPSSVQSQLAAKVAPGSFNDVEALKTFLSSRTISADVKATLQSTLPVDTFKVKAVAESTSDDATRSKLAVLTDDALSSSEARTKIATVTNDVSVPIAIRRQLKAAIGTEDRVDADGLDSVMSNVRIPEGVKDRVMSMVNGAAGNEENKIERLKSLGGDVNMTREARQAVRSVLPVRLDEAQMLIGTSRMPQIVHDTVANISNPAMNDEDRRATVMAVLLNRTAVNSMPSEARNGLLSLVNAEPRVNAAKCTLAIERMKTSAPGVAQQLSSLNAQLTADPTANGEVAVKEVNNVLSSTTVPEAVKQSLRAALPFDDVMASSLVGASVATATGRGGFRALQTNDDGDLAVPLMVRNSIKAILVEPSITDEDAKARVESAYRAAGSDMVNVRPDVKARVQSLFGAQPRVDFGVLNRTLVGCPVGLAMNITAKLAEVGKDDIEKVRSIALMDTLPAGIKDQLTESISVSPVDVDTLLNCSKIPSAIKALIARRRDGSNGTLADQRKALRPIFYPDSANVIATKGRHADTLDQDKAELSSFWSQPKQVRDTCKSALGAVTGPDPSKWASLVTGVTGGDLPRDLPTATASSLSLSTRQMLSSMQTDDTLTDHNQAESLLYSNSVPMADKDMIRSMMPVDQSEIIGAMLVLPQPQASMLTECTNKSLSSAELRPKINKVVDTMNLNIGEADLDRVRSLAYRAVVPDPKVQSSVMESIEVDPSIAPEVKASIRTHCQDVTREPATNVRAVLADERIPIKAKESFASSMPVDSDRLSRFVTLPEVSEQVKQPIRMILLNKTATEDDKKRNLTQIILRGDLSEENVASIKEAMHMQPRVDMNFLNRTSSSLSNQVQIKIQASLANRTKPEIDRVHDILRDPSIDVESKKALSACLPIKEDKLQRVVTDLKAKSDPSVQLFPTDFLQNKSMTSSQIKLQVQNLTTFYKTPSNVAQKLREGLGRDPPLDAQTVVSDLRKVGCSLPSDIDLELKKSGTGDATTRTQLRIALERPEVSVNTKNQIHKICGDIPVWRMVNTSQELPQMPMLSQFIGQIPNSGLGAQEAIKTLVNRSSAFIIGQHRPAGVCPLAAVSQAVTLPAKVPVDMVNRVADKWAPCKDASVAIPVVPIQQRPTGGNTSFDPCADDFARFCSATKDDKLACLRSNAAGLSAVCMSYLKLSVGPKLQEPCATELSACVNATTLQERMACLKSNTVLTGDCRAKVVLIETKMPCASIVAAKCKDATTTDAQLLCVSGLVSSGQIAAEDPCALNLPTPDKPCTLEAVTICPNESLTASIVECLKRNAAATINETDDVKFAFISAPCRNQLSRDEEDTVSSGLSFNSTDPRRSFVALASTDDWGFFSSSPLDFVAGKGTPLEKAMGATGASIFVIVAAIVVIGVVGALVFAGFMFAQRRKETRRKQFNSEHFSTFMDARDPHNAYSNL